MKLHRFLSLLFFALPTLLAGQGSEYALHFDGVNDYVEANAVCDGLSGGAITFSAWVYPEGEGTGNATILGFNESNNTSTNNVNILYHNKGLSAFVYFDQGSNNIPTTGYFPTGHWYHVAVAIDGFNQAKVYVNGVESLALTAAETPTSNDRFSIGQEWDGAFTSAFFEGEIDEVRVWNYARTPEEIRSDMCKKLNGDEFGLVAYFRLDEGTGSQCLDAVTQQNIGDLVGMEENDWVFSGAPLGDEAVFIYPQSTNWEDVSLELPLDDNAEILVSSVAGNSDGVFLYRVEEAPNTLSGLSGPTENYYGVFATGLATVYDLGIKSVNPPPCNAFDVSFDFFSRNDNASGSWALLEGQYYPGDCVALLPEQSTLGNTNRGEYVLLKRATLSDDEVVHSGLFSVFPNPASWKSPVYLTGDVGAEDILVYDHLGRKVDFQWSPAEAGQFRLQFAERVPGSYCMIFVKTDMGWTCSVLAITD